MAFASPFWLIALVPWTAAVLWLLWGRRRRTYVPFLELWRGPALQKPAKKALHPPPIFIALAILGMLLALLAAARPMLKMSTSAAHPLTMIVDRGLSMSSLGGGVPRYAVAAQRAVDALSTMLPASTTPVELRTLPPAASGPRHLYLGQVKGAVADLPPTAMETQTLLEESVRQRLANTTGPVVVISDRHLAAADPRLIQFSAEPANANVGIARISARESPSPQVMVRLRNDSSQSTMPLAVSWGQQQVKRVVELPAQGQERDYFIDLPRLDNVLEAAISADDAQPADDRAWLVREGSFPRLEPRAPLSPELRRMVEVYARSRPPGETSQRVALVGAEADLPADLPAVVIPPPTGPRAQGNVIAASHPVTANVNWSAFIVDVQTAAEAPKGWMPVLSIGQRVLIAVRSEPVRQVWVGFDAPTAWSATPDFVVLWANIFTWAGRGQERFVGYAIGHDAGGWKPVEEQKVSPRPEAGLWPGLYQSPDGALRGFNAPAVAPFAAAITTADWRERLQAEEGLVQQREVASWTLAAALCCLAASAITWKQRNLTPVSTARTFL